MAATAFLLRRRPVCYAGGKQPWLDRYPTAATEAVTSSQPPPSFHRRAIERDISGKLSYRAVINEKQGIYLPSTNLTA